MSITATVVEVVERTNFLPTYFKEKFCLGETLIYSFMDKLFEEYSGGYWEFFKLSNGGFYMAPTGYEKITCNADNGFCGEMSGNAAGIVVTLYTLNVIANKTKQDHFIEMYYRLIDYISVHEESGKIYAAID